MTKSDAADEEERKREKEIERERERETDAETVTKGGVVDACCDQVSGCMAQTTSI